MKPTILIVDDERQYVELLGELLEKYGLEPHTAYDAGDALFAMRSKLPDLILMDLRMPEMDGMDLIQRMRAETGWGDVPIIVVSARTGKDVQQQVLDAGANRFLPKPFSSEDLMALLGEFVAVRA